jgi:hypothetical protein
LHSTSARLWAEVFALEPRLANDPTNRLRHAATRCTALAGCGKGNENPPLDEPSKSALRGQACEWLKADLAAWSKVCAAGQPQVWSTVRQGIQSWTSDPDLAGVRDPDALARLPEAERADWLKLWAEVRRFISLGDSPVPP